MRSMVNEAKFTKRYSTAQYEWEEYSLGAVVDEKESGASVLTELKAQINEAFIGEAPATKTETKAADKKAAKTEKKEEKKDAKNKSSKASVADDEVSNGESDDEEDSGDATAGDADDEATDGDDSDGDDDSSDDTSGDGDSEEDTKASKSKSGKGGKADEGKSSGKKFKKKAQNYNRSIEQHKEIFSGVLRSVSPDWKKSDELKAKAKKASESLEGEEFLDENGEVVQSFKDMVRNHMKPKAKK